jgi:ethanolamine-phosphate phospho-lyase
MDSSSDDDKSLMMPGMLCFPPAAAASSAFPHPPQDISLVKTDSFASTDTAVAPAAAAATAAAATAAAAATDNDDTGPLALRRRYFAPNATLSHPDAPLTLSRGVGCRLHCAHTGRAYLDAQNNVAHLGHGHAGVAAAVSAQLLALNTNSRYVSPELGLYCRELVGTLPKGMQGGEQQQPPPPPLVFLTNSGSEANDLALRLARAHHAERFGCGNGDAAPPAFHVAVLGGAYHGHLDSVVRLSPYKFWAAPSSSPSPPSSSAAAHAHARTKPSWVHVIPLPDEFVGGQATRFCDGAAAARAVVRAARKQGGRIGLAVAEAIPSCAGQALLPAGFLAALFSTLRQEEPNVLCCVDEVQTGFGRVGAPHFWAFEPQLLMGPPNCLPDLITLGKPAGNGFPLAGLIATRAASHAFCELSGEPYFNTYGGSNCSVAAGRAVLRAVKEERLAERAAATGVVLGALLRRVADAHKAHVRDVRGVGLFWGVDIGRVVAVADAGAADCGAMATAAATTAATATVPAPAKASWLARRMRDVSGVLVSVDGVYGNVLKIKPPMVFGAQESRELAAALDAALWALDSGAVAADERAALERRERESWLGAVLPVREMYERNARELGLMM